MTLGAALIWSPFADEDSASRVASTLLEEKLIACANILPSVTSVYLWKGQTEKDTEVAVLFKTSHDLLERATDRLAQLHPYETPAVIGWRAEAVPAATCEWLRQSLGPSD